MNLSSLLRLMLVIIIIIGGWIIIIIIRIPIPIPEPTCIRCNFGLLKFLGIAEVILGAVSLGMLNKAISENRINR